MDDKELLGWAAKAAGMPVLPSDRPWGRDEKGWFYNYVGKNSEWGLFDNSKPNLPKWNPLTDDGDALRLAVKLRFGIKDFAPHDEPEIVQIPPDAALIGMIEIWREDDDDPLYVEWYKAGFDRYAATRRAIVRAAALIGQQGSNP